MKRLFAAGLASVILLLNSAGAQEGNSSASRNLVDTLRLEGTDPEVFDRYVRFAVAAVGIGIALWAIERLISRMRGSRNARGRSRPAPMNVSGVLASIADAGTWIFERLTFKRREEAPASVIHRSVRGDWGPPPAAPTRPAPSAARKNSSDLFDLSQEIEVFGVGSNAGFCVRSVLLHRDEFVLVLKLSETLDALPWKAGDDVQLYFWRPNDAGYIGTSKLIEHRRAGPGFLVVEHPKNVQRQQKRIYVRVPYTQVVDILHIPLGRATESIGVDQPAGGFLRAQFEDVSAGGFRLLIDAEFQPGDYVSISRFEPAGGAEIMARVVSELAPGVDARRRFGLQYIGVAASHRDEISRFIFSTQRGKTIEAPQSESVAESVRLEAEQRSAASRAPVQSVVGPKVAPAVDDVAAALAIDAGLGDAGLAPEMLASDPLDPSVGELETPEAEFEDGSAIDDPKSDRMVTEVIDLKRERRMRDLAVAEKDAQAALDEQAREAEQAEAEQAATEQTERGEAQEAEDVAAIAHELAADGDDVAVGAEIESALDELFGEEEPNPTPPLAEAPGADDLPMDESVLDEAVPEDAVVIEDDDPIAQEAKEFFGEQENEPGDEDATVDDASKSQVSDEANATMDEIIDEANRLDPEAPPHVADVDEIPIDEIPDS